MRQNTLNNSQLFGILGGVAAVLGLFVFLVRQAPQISEEPDARDRVDAARRAQGRLEQFGAARPGPVSIDPQVRLRNKFHQPQTSVPLSDATGSVPKPAVEPEEEDELIQVPKRLQPAQGGSVNHLGGNAEVAQQTTGESSPETDGTQAAADAGGEKAEGTQKAANGGDQKTEVAQQGAAKTDGGDPAEPTKIKANAMDWNPDTAYKGGDGNVHASPGSTLSTQVDLSSPAGSVAIWAHADQTPDGWPKIRVSVDGTPMGEVTINSTDEQKYHLPIYADPGHSVVELTPVSDSSDPSVGQDPNVHIRKIKIWPQAPSH
jgi:hypothetical protein